MLNLGETEATLGDLQRIIDWDGSNCLELTQYWLVLSDCGRLIANCFNRAFVFFSAQGSYSSFPSREPSDNDASKVISIVHVGNHYMSVNLHAASGGVTPAPISMTWRTMIAGLACLEIQHWRVKIHSQVPPLITQ